MITSDEILLTMIHKADIAKFFKWDLHKKKLIKRE